MQKTQETSSATGSRGSPGEENGNPLQDSCLENLTDREAWWATVHRIAKGWTRLQQLSMTQEQLYKVNSKNTLLIALPCLEWAFSFSSTSIFIHWLMFQTP